MASKYGRNAWTVQEATNAADAYASYKFQTLTLDGTTEKTTSSWANQPAKEVLIFSKGGAANDAGITIAFKIAGSYGADIIIDNQQLPFTVKGLLIEEVTIHGDGSGTDDDVLSILSFH